MPTFRLLLSPPEQFRTDAMTGVLAVKGERLEYPSASRSARAARAYSGGAELN